MSRITLVVVSFIFASFISVGQDRNSIWAFGDSAGIDFTNLNSPQPYYSGMVGRGSSVSICDSAGFLQVYAATMGYLNTDWNTRVFNNQNSILSDCDSIAGNDWYSELVLLPRPGHLNLYYLFSVGFGSINSGLFVSYLDMNVNGGSGSVTQQNIQVNNNPISDCLTAVKHGNGKDWWIISKYYNPSTSFNRFNVYLVTGDSIYSPVVSDFNDNVDGFFKKIAWHPSFNKFMLKNFDGYLAEFNFDRCSGAITMDRTIFPPQTSNYDRFFWECAYSPNGDVLYMGTLSTTTADTYYLIQYNLAAADIPASADTLDSFMYPIGTGAVRLAPDGKIYFSRAYECNVFPSCYPYPDSVRNAINENLSVINNPDSLGNACDYQPYSFYLGGKRTYYGLPNNPNYDLPALAGSVCDTILLSDKDQFSIKTLENIFYPNPAINKLYFSKIKEKIKLRIVNLIGIPVLEIDGPDSPIDVSSFSSGIYLIELEMRGYKIVQKIIKL